MSFRVDAYRGYSRDELRDRCVKLCRANINKDVLICALVQFGSVDAMPPRFAEEVRKIVAIYGGEDGESVENGK